MTLMRAWLTKNDHDDSVVMILLWLRCGDGEKNGDGKTWIWSNVLAICFWCLSWRCVSCWVVPNCVPVVIGLLVALWWCVGSVWTVLGDVLVVFLFCLCGVPRWCLRGIYWLNRFTSHGLKRMKREPWLLGLYVRLLEQILHMFDHFCSLRWIVAPISIIFIKSGCSDLNTIFGTKHALLGAHHASPDSEGASCCPFLQRQ